MHLSASFLALLATFVLPAISTPILYDGRTPLTYTEADINTPKAPYVYVVKGYGVNATEYVDFSKILPPTPLWYKQSGPLGLIPKPIEQTIHVKIDNSSVFIPGGNPANAQYGFRRTELISQNDKALLEVGTTVFHFSIAKDDLNPLNLKHEYQIVFIEPNDGTHVFGVRVGSNFAAPTQKRLPTPNARNLEVVDHAWNVIYSVPFIPLTWHNFAVQVDWDKRTLGVFASTGAKPLKKVTGVVQNPTTKPGVDGQGDFHIGLLKLPLANPRDTPEQQGDVVHRGIQEGTKEGIFYSGVFVEAITGGISAGYGNTISPIV